MEGAAAVASATPFQPVAERVPVLVQRHGRRRVAGHRLDDPDVGFGGDGEG